MNKKIIGTIIVVAVAAVSFGIINFASTPITDASCVNVIVDFQSLKSEKTTKCISVDGKTSALSVLKTAGFTLAGTDKYGLQIVCRINGLPDAIHAIKSSKHKGYVEKCADMPADFAYWALLIKTAKKDWTYAPVGIADLKVAPGEQIALVFSIDNKMVLPN